MSNLEKFDFSPFLRFLSKLLFKGPISCFSICLSVCLYMWHTKKQDYSERHEWIKIPSLLRNKY